MVVKQNGILNFEVSSSLMRTSSNELDKNDHFDFIVKKYKINSLMFLSTFIHSNVFSGWSNKLCFRSELANLFTETAFR